MRKLQYILRGGTIRFKPDPKDPHERVPAPINLKLYGLRYLLGGVILFGLTPLLILPSDVGFVEFDYPQEFEDSSTFEQYFQTLLFNIVILLKSAIGIDPAFLPDVPKPVTQVWRGIIAIVLLIADGCSLWWIITGFRRINFNYRQLERRKTDVGSLSNM